MGEWYEAAKDVRRTMDAAGAMLTDAEAYSVPGLYPLWADNTEYRVGDRRQHGGLLYRCVQAHTSQSAWEPPNVPALWVRTSTEEWPEWIQPTGAHDAYAQGAKVAHNGKRWTSDIAANTYEPGVYGWTEVTV